MVDCRINDNWLVGAVLLSSVRLGVGTRLSLDQKYPDWSSETRLRAGVDTLVHTFLRCTYLSPAAGAIGSVASDGVGIILNMNKNKTLGLIAACTAVIGVVVLVLNSASDVSI